jgi:hypothetical protein
MNLGELEVAINLALDDRSLEENIKPWINNAILELAADFELPALKRRTPYSLTLTEDNWLFDLPADFHKKLFRCADENYRDIKRYRTLDALDALNLAHDATGDRPTAVATVDGDPGGSSGEKSQIGVYPKADTVIHLWYYRRPTLLARPSDIPVCIPDAYHSRVIVPKVVIKGLEHLQDQVENFDPKGLQLWQGKLVGGLQGSKVEGIGLINYLAKLQGGVKRTGGRDPVGARYYA